MQTFVLIFKEINLPIKIIVIFIADRPFTEGCVNTVLLKQCRGSTIKLNIKKGGSTYRKRYIQCSISSTILIYPASCQLETITVGFLYYFRNTIET